jgi:bifunctional non-homologous end joining protein LigD
VAKDYAGKRDFGKTPEPSPQVDGNVDPTAATPGTTFMVHQHHATRLHFDLRLEMLNGDTPVLVSWAVPKNLPQRKGERHLAVHVEDHPFDYGRFSGSIPKGEYGGGEVRIFDSGTYEVLEQEPKKLTIDLHGKRLNGVWHMIQFEGKETKKGGSSSKDNWLVFMRENRRETEPLPEIAPMMATLVDEPFDREGWLFEPKWDGVRAIATCTDQTVLISRNLNDITASYPELAKLHEQVVGFEAVVDGEIVAMHQGRPSFERLQSRINLRNERDIAQAMKSCPVTFVAFDLLYLDGRNLSDTPLIERKALLDELFVPAGFVQVSPVIENEGKLLFAAAEAKELEGIVAKRANSPYRPGKRSKDWLKIKTTHTADLVVGGWTPGEGSRSKSFGALLLGAYENGTLRFVGSVGTGFKDDLLAKMMPLLEELASDENPFDSDPVKDKPRWGKPIRDPRWIDPLLVVMVEFRELTSAGRLRAPSFKGFRNDKDPSDCSFDELGLKGVEVG